MINRYIFLPILLFFFTALNAQVPCDNIFFTSNIADQSICAGESVTLTASANVLPNNNLVISAVFDGPLSGGTPKGIELYAIKDISDLSLYGVGSANNGGGSDGQEFTFPAISANAGDYIYLSSDSATFNQWFGFNAAYITSAVNINGDDAMELFYQSNVIDVFGDINVDGNGEPWEYMDGWAYRNSSTGPDGSVFLLNSWSFSGPNALDGESSNSTASSPIPVGTFVHNGTSPFNTYTIDVTASSAMDYTFAGSFAGADPAISINLGDTLVFNVNAPSHPFWINTFQGTGSANGVAVANNGTNSGTITWVPTAAGTYYYNCELHSMMTNTITVGPPAISYVWTNGVTNGVAFSPSVSNQYIVSASDGSGCALVDTVVVAVTTVDLGDTLSFCASDSILLDAGAGYNYYSWNTGDTTQTIYASQSGDYAATVGNAEVVSNNYSMEFDMMDDYVEFQGPVIPSSGDVTIMSWAYCPYEVQTGGQGGSPNNGGFGNGYRQIISQGDNSAAYFIGYEPGGTMRVFHNWQAIPVQYPFGEWVHIAVVSEQGSGTKLYLNGVLEAQTSLTGLPNPGDFRIGRQWSSSQSFEDWFGNIDELNIWDIALSDQEIQTYMNCPPSGSESGLIACWNFEAGTGSNVVDLSPNGFDAPISNAVWSVDVPTQGPCLGCTATDSVYVQEDALPAVNAGTDQTVCSGDLTTLIGSGAVSYSWDNGISDGVPFNATTTTTYSVAGTDANGCVNTDQVDVIVNSLPAVDAGADQTICLQDTVVLNGSGALSYSWDNGVNDGAYFIPAITATYTVTGTDANNCSNSDQVQVIVNPLPAVNAGADVAVCVGDSIALNGSGAATYSWDNGVTDGITFIPLFSNTYNVIGTDANGCVNADAVDVTVNTLPTVDAGIDLSVCQGDPVTLSGSGAVNYSWDNGVVDGVSFSASNTTTYTVIGTDGNGCENLDDLTLTVTPSPTVVAIAAEDTVCVNFENVLLTASPSGGVFAGPGVTDDRFYPPVAGTGTHTIIYSYTDANSGCIGTDTLTIVVLECTGIYSADGIVIELFPNPNNGIFAISSNKRFNGKVQITNSLGQLVLEKQLDNVTSQFDLSLENSSGVYFVSIFSAEGRLMKTQKVLVQ